MIQQNCSLSNELSKGLSCRPYRRWQSQLYQPFAPHWRQTLTTIFLVFILEAFCLVILFCNIFLLRKKMIWVQIVYYIKIFRFNQFWTLFVENVRYWLPSNWVPQPVLRGQKVFAGPERNLGNNYRKKMKKYLTSEIE